MYDSLNKWNSNRPFKLIEGKNDPTTFLPLDTKIGGQTRRYALNKWSSYTCL